MDKRTKTRMSLVVFLVVFCQVLEGRHIRTHKTMKVLHDNSMDKQFSVMKKRAQITGEMKINGTRFQSMGCWRDAWERALPALEGDHHLLMDPNYKTRTYSLFKCARAALDKQLKMFGLENGGQCFGGVNGERRLSKYGISHDCKENGKGGPWSLQAYRFTAFPVDAINGDYSSWSRWTTCSKTCGHGVRRRMRTCSNPSPSKGGDDCERLGPSVESKNCNIGPCTGKVPERNAYSGNTDLNPLMDEGGQVHVHRPTFSTTVKAAAPATQRPTTVLQNPGHGKEKEKVKYLADTTTKEATASSNSTDNHLKEESTQGVNPLPGSTPAKVTESNRDSGKETENVAGSGVKQSSDEVQKVHEKGNLNADAVSSAVKPVSSNDGSLKVVDSAVAQNNKVQENGNQVQEKGNHADAVSSAAKPVGSKDGSLKAVDSPGAQNPHHESKEGQFKVEESDTPNTLNTHHDVKEVPKQEQTSDAVEQTHHLEANQFPMPSIDQSEEIKPHKQISEDDSNVMDIDPSIVEDTYNGAPVVPSSAVQFNTALGPVVMGEVSSLNPDSTDTEVDDSSSAECFCPSKVCIANADLAFLVDGSSDIPQIYFAHVLDYLKGLTRSFDTEQTQISLVAYGDDATAAFSFGSVKNTREIDDGIDAVSYMGGEPKTGNALFKAKKNLFETSSRPGVSHALVLLTSGSSSDDIGPPAEELRDAGVKMTAIGLGKLANVKELIEIASEPKSSHVFTAFLDTLPDRMNEIVAGICSDVEGTLVDRRESCNCAAKKPKKAAKQDKQQTSTEPKDPSKPMNKQQAPDSSSKPKSANKTIPSKDTSQAKLSNQTSEEDTSKPKETTPLQETERPKLTNQHSTKTEKGPIESKKASGNEQGSKPKLTNQQSPETELRPSESKGTTVSEQGSKPNLINQQSPETVNRPMESNKAPDSSEQGSKPKLTNQQSPATGTTPTESNNASASEQTTKPKLVSQQSLEVENKPKERKEAQSNQETPLKPKLVNQQTQQTDLKAERPKLPSVTDTIQKTPAPQPGRNIKGVPKEEEKGGNSNATDISKLEEPVSNENAAAAEKQPQLGEKSIKGAGDLSTNTSSATKEELHEKLETSRMSESSKTIEKNKKAQDNNSSSNTVNEQSQSTNKAPIKVVENKDKGNTVPSNSGLIHKGDFKATSEEQLLKSENVKQDPKNEKLQASTSPPEAGSPTKEQQNVQESSGMGNPKQPTNEPATETTPQDLNSEPPQGSTEKANSQVSAQNKQGQQNIAISEQAQVQQAEGPSSEQSQITNPNQEVNLQLQHLQQQLQQQQQQPVEQEQLQENAANAQMQQMSGNGIGTLGQEASHQNTEQGQQALGASPLASQSDVPATGTEPFIIPPPANNGTIDAAMQTQNGQQFSSAEQTQSAVPQALELQGTNVISTTREKSPELPEDCSVNLGVVLDSKTTAFSREENARKLLEFAKKVTHMFPISPEGNRVGMMVYSGSPKLKVVHFDHFLDQDTMDKAIDSASYLNMEIKTGKVLNFAQQHLFARIAPGKQNVLLLITDGVSYDDVTRPAIELKRRGVEIFCIGVGDNVVRRELETIASTPSNDHVLMTSYDMLDATLEDIKHRICLSAHKKEEIPPDSHTKHANCDSADIGFLIDGSRTVEVMGKGNFEKVLDFVKNVSLSFLALSRKTSRIGAVVYASEPFLEIPFDSYETVEEFLTAIDSIKYPGTSTRTGKALEFTRRNLFGSPSGRPNVPKVLVVLTEGSSRDDVRKSSEELHRDGVDVISVGLGPVYDRVELGNMASLPSEDNVITVDYPELYTKTKELQNMICMATKKHNLKI